MKKLFKTLALSSFVLASAVFTSCSDDNSGIESDGEGNEGGNGSSTFQELKITPTSLYPEITINSTANSTETVKVHFEGANKGMRRLYITKNDGTGRIIYNINDHVAPAVSLNNDDKSIDLSKDNKQEINFTIPFETPKEKDGVIVYKLWVTGSPFLSSKGDIENIDFRNAYNDGAVGTIMITAGGANPSSPVKEFSIDLNNAISLYAPADDGSTKSFVSILNGKTYKIAQQKKSVTNGATFTEEEKGINAEYVSYWDFGYFYTNNASFSSAHDYMNAFENGGKAVIDITNISGLSQSNLNKFYFKRGSSISFDAVETSGDLDGVSAENQTISNLTEGEVIEFVDRNGIKGLIRIDKIVKGYSTSDYIKFSVKVQNVDFIKL